jgi:hypothetical protein
MLNYLITCKECSYTHVTDSSADLANAGRNHRAGHDRAHASHIREFHARKQRIDKIKSDILAAELTLEYLEKAPEEIEKIKEQIATLKRRCEMEENQ